MNYVFHANGFNSTAFTNCCETAICDDQSFCPRCKMEIYPGEKNHEGRYYTDHERNLARFKYAHRGTSRKD